MPLVPLQVTDTFNRSFQLSGPGARCKPHPAAKPLRMTDQSSAEGFVRRLSLSAMRWRQLLKTHYPHNLHNPSQLPVAGIARVITRGVLEIYELPNIRTVAPIADGKGLGYSFFPGPQGLPNTGGERLEIASMDEAKALVSGLRKNADFWQHVLMQAGLRRWGGSDRASGAQNEVIKSLAEGTLCVYRTPFEPPVSKTPTAGTAEPLAPTDAKIPPPPPAAKPSVKAEPMLVAQAAANDQMDQAKALLEAASNGDAFCEECQKRQQATA